MCGVLDVGVFGTCNFWQCLYSKVYLKANGSSTSSQTWPTTQIDRGAIQLHKIEDSQIWDHELVPAKVHIPVAADHSRLGHHSTRHILQTLRDQVRPSREFQGFKDMTPKILQVLLMKEHDCSPKTASHTIDQASMAR